MVNNCDESQSDIESDVEEIPDPDLNDSGLRSRLIDLAVSIDDNPHDETWLSPKEAKRVAQRVPLLRTGMGSNNLSSKENFRG